MKQQEAAIRRSLESFANGAFDQRISQSPVAFKQKRLQKFLKLQVKSFMTRNVLTVPKNMSLRELDHLFEVEDFNSFPVVEDHHLIGIVSKFDFLRAFIFTPSTVFPHYDELMKRKVEEIMTKEVHTVHPATPLTRVLQMMVEMKNKSFPVVDKKGRVLGMISRIDIIRALND